MEIRSGTFYLSRSGGVRKGLAMLAAPRLREMMAQNKSYGQIKGG